MGCKSCISQPGTWNTLQQIEDDFHEKANQQCQTKQVDFYNSKTGNDKWVLNSKEPVFVWNTTKYLGSTIGN